MILTSKKLLNILFVFWFFSELFFQHTLISQIALVLFCVAIIVCVKTIRFNLQIISLLLFVCWSIANIVSGHTIDSSTSWDMTITLIMNFVFLLLFAQYYRFIDDIRKILRLISLVVLLFSVVCIFWGFNSLVSVGRMHIEGINVNTAAHYSVYVSIWLFYLMIFEKRITMINVISLFIYIAFVIMTGSRGAFFALIAGIYLLFILRNKKTALVKIIPTTAIVALILILIMNIEPLYAVIGYRLKPVFDYFMHGSYEEGSMYMRMAYSQLALSRAKESLLWGQGLDCFRWIDGAYGAYSHNNYAEILFSLGIPGVTIYYLPYALNLKYYFNCIFKKNGLAVVTGIFILVYLMSEPFRITYYNRAFLIIPIMSYLYLENAKRENADPN